MFKWLDDFFNASFQTKIFIITIFLFGFAIVVTTIYCYARLDYVRSYKTPTKEITPT